jgi:hypothetical protein
MAQSKDSGFLPGHDIISYWGSRYTGGRVCLHALEILSVAGKDRVLLPFQPQTLKSRMRRRLAGVDMIAD